MNISHDKKNLQKLDKNNENLNANDQKNSDDTEDEQKQQQEQPKLLEKKNVPKEKLLTENHSSFMAKQNKPIISSMFNIFL